MSVFPRILMILLVSASLFPIAGLAEEVEPKMNPEVQKNLVRLSRITVEPARLAEYLEFAVECGKRSMAEEPGVLMMYSMSEKARPHVVTILEIYADQDAYQRHIQTPHFQKYKQKTLKMVQKLELLDQTPLIPEMRMK